MSYNNPTERTLPASLLWTREEPQGEAVSNRAELESVSDESLLIELRNKNRDALTELFRRYSRLAFSIGLRVLRDTGEAEEIVQEVFLFLYQRADLFDEKKGAAKAWLVQIAYHRSLDRREYLSRRNFYFGTESEGLADTLRGQGDLERDLGSKLNRERLKEAFQNLSDRQSLTLELFFFGELDFHDIAARLDESLENVRHYYYRGLERLRKHAFIKELRDKSQS